MTSRKRHLVQVKLYKSITTKTKHFTYIQRSHAQSNGWGQNGLFLLEEHEWSGLLVVCTCHLHNKIHFTVVLLFAIHWPNLSEKPAVRIHQVNTTPTKWGTNFDNYNERGIFNSRTHEDFSSTSFWHRLIPVHVESERMITRRTWRTTFTKVTTPPAPAIHNMKSMIHDFQEKHKHFPHHNQCSSGDIICKESEYEDDRDFLQQGVKALLAPPYWVNLRGANPLGRSPKTFDKSALNRYITPKIKSLLGPASCEGGNLD